MEKLKEKIEQAAKPGEQQKQQSKEGQEGEVSENSQQPSKEDSENKPPDSPEGGKDGSEKPGEEKANQQANPDRSGTPDENQTMKSENPGAAGSVEADNREKELKEGEDGRELRPEDIRYQDVELEDQLDQSDPNYLGEDAQIKQGESGGNYRIPLKELELAQPTAPKNSKFRIPLEYADKLK